MYVKTLHVKKTKELLHSELKLLSDKQFKKTHIENVLYLFLNVHFNFKINNLYTSYHLMDLF